MLKLPIHILPICLLLLLSSCTSLDTHVTIYHQPKLQQKIEHQTYAYYPLAKLNQANDLQYNYVTNIIDNYMVEQGFQKASLKKAKLSIIVIYAEGKNFQEHSYSPVYGQTGSEVTSSYTTGNFNTNNFGAFSNGNFNTQTTYQATPTFGVVGEVPTETTYYPYYVLFYIFDKNTLIHNPKEAKPIYMAQLVAVDTENDPNNAYPLMFKAFFSIFPGSNGESQTVNAQNSD